MGLFTRILVKSFRSLILHMCLNVEIPYKVNLCVGIRFLYPYNIVINPNSYIGTYVKIFHDAILGAIDYIDGGQIW